MRSIAFEIPGKVQAWQRTGTGPHGHFTKPDVDNVKAESVALFMAARKKVSDEELLKAYKQTGSVKKAGILLGINGASVHERLVKLGVNKPINTLQPHEKRTIALYYLTTPDEEFDLKTLAKKLGRSHNFVCRHARLEGLTDQKRSRNVEALRNQAQAHLNNGQSRYRQGDRPDLPGLRFRSAWEANYARYLNWLVDMGAIHKWSFEPEVFWFHQIKRGVRSYLPDFKIWPVNDEYSYFVEIKGYMDPKSLTKLKRMRIYYPDIEVKLVDAKEYKALAKQYAGLIPNWERPKAGKKACL